MDDHAPFILSITITERGHNRYLIKFDSYDTEKNSTLKNEKMLYFYLFVKKNHLRKNVHSLFLKLFSGVV